MTSIAQALRRADEALNVAAGELTVAAVLWGADEAAVARAHRLAVTIEDDLTALRAMTAGLEGECQRVAATSAMRFAVAPRRTAGALLTAMVLSGLSPVGALADQAPKQPALNLPPNPGGEASGEDDDAAPGQPGDEDATSPAPAPSTPAPGEPVVPAVPMAPAAPPAPEPVAPTAPAADPAPAPAQQPSPLEQAPAAAPSEPLAAQAEPPTPTTPQPSPPPQSPAAQPATPAPTQVQAPPTIAAPPPATSSVATTSRTAEPTLVLFTHRTRHRVFTRRPLAMPAAVAVASSTRPRPAFTSPQAIGSSPSRPVPGARHTVRAGETLWSISARLLPAGASDADIALAVARVWQLNAARIGTGSPDRLPVGVTLLLASKQTSTRKK